MKTTTSIKIFTAALDRALEAYTEVEPHIIDDGLEMHKLVLIANGNRVLRYQASSRDVAQRVKQLLIGRIYYHVYRHDAFFHLFKKHDKRTAFFNKRENHRQYSTERLQSIADTICKEQVSRNTWMCVGARKFTVLNDERYQAGGLKAVVTIRPGKKNILFIRLTWDDMYRVQVWQERTGQLNLEESLDEVYCDQLDECIYWLCTPIGRDPVWEASIKAGKIMFDDFTNTTNLVG